METSKKKLKGKSILKQNGKYLYNENGSPVVINGKYLFLNEDGSTALLDHHPNENKLEKELEGEDPTEELTLNLESVLDPETTENNVVSSNSVSQQDSRPTGTANSEGSWDITATRLLLSLYKIMKECVMQGKIPTLKRMWAKIGARLQLHGYSYTPSQIENRYKTLLRRYRRKLVTTTRCRVGKETPYDREAKEIFDQEAKNADLVLTPEGDHITLTEFLGTAGISGDRDTHFVARGQRSRKVFKLTPKLARKFQLQRPMGAKVATSPTKPAPPVPPPYYTNHARRPDVMEELRDLRLNTLAKLRVMEDKRDAFNGKVLQELKYRNELLQKLLEHVP